MRGPPEDHSIVPLLTHGIHDGGGRVCEQRHGSMELQALSCSSLWAFWFLLRTREDETAAQVWGMINTKWRGDRSSAPVLLLFSLPSKEFFGLGNA